MKVYMPLNKLESRNKYLYNFYKCLKNLEIDLSIDKNFWLKKEGDWDIILIHWPEHLPFIKTDKLIFEKFQLKIRLKFRLHPFFFQNSQLMEFLKSYRNH